MYFHNCLGNSTHLSLGGEAPTPAAQRGGSQVRFLVGCGWCGVVTWTDVGEFQ